MADVAFSERQKKIFRILLKLGMAKLKFEEKVIAENLTYSPNEVIKNLNALLLAGANQIQPDWQRHCIKLYGRALLWIIQKDTAYRDVFFWMLYQLLKKSKELIPIVEPYVKPPEEWIPNLWDNSRKKTRLLKKEGKIPADMKSFEETIFVPDTQDKRHQKLLKKK